MTPDQDTRQPAHHHTMPDCVHTATTDLRIYREVLADGTHQDTLEQLFRDGHGNPFWAPVPVVLAEPTPEGAHDE